jgi:hypothetical protein
MVLTCVPLKSLLAPVCHSLKFFSLHAIPSGLHPIFTVNSPECGPNHLGSPKCPSKMPTSAAAALVSSHAGRPTGRAPWVAGVQARAVERSPRRGVALYRLSFTRTGRCQDRARAQLPRAHVVHRLGSSLSTLTLTPSGGPGRNTLKIPLHTRKITHP